MAITKRGKTADELRIESQITILKPDNKKYPGFKTNVQFFYPNIDYKEIRQQLNLLVEKHKSDTSIDFDYAKLALDFISVDSFFDEIAGEKGNYLPTKIYYDLCLYLAKFPVETSKIYNEFSERYGRNQYFSILDILKSNGEKEKYPDLVAAIYENLNQIEDFKFYSIFYYYFDLYNQGKLTYEKFDALVTEIVPLDDYFTQQLDAFQEKCDCPSVDEYQLTTLSNAMAWDAVTKRNTDKALLKKALKWSKLSVELSPTTHYYMDTLAHLEYFLGNKEDAMELESKAILLATDGKEEDLKGYQETLEKMQLNTLKY